MEPNMNVPGGPSPEAAPQPASTPETAPDQQVEVGQIEIAPAPAAPEVDRTNREGANQNQGMIQPAQQVQPVQPAQDPAQDDSNQTAQQVLQDAPTLASDVDVLEKEWVDKAKQIVKDSSNDPYAQNHKVSILKADYMKKRYGKDIKIPEDKPAKA